MPVFLIASIIASVPTTTRVHVDTDPPGASIELVYSGKRYKTGRKTPAVLALPAGSVTFSFKRFGYQTFEVSLKLKARIMKLEKYRLIPAGTTFTIDYDPGRLVLVDGKPARYSTPDAPFTPCAVKIQRGRHVVSLVKDGWQDVNVLASVASSKDRTKALTVKKKPREGTSRTFAEKPWLLAIGTWAFVERGRTKLNIAFLPDGRIEPEYRSYSGEPASWKVIDSSIRLITWIGSTFTVEVLSDQLMEAKFGAREVTLIRTTKAPDPSQPPSTTVPERE